MVLRQLLKSTSSKLKHLEHFSAKCVLDEPYQNISVSFFLIDLVRSNPKLKMVKLEGIRDEVVEGVRLEFILARS